MGTCLLIVFGVKEINFCQEMGTENRVHDSVKGLLSLFIYHENDIFCSFSLL